MKTQSSFFDSPTEPTGDRLSAATLGVLANCVVEAHHIKLPPAQLERATYEAVNEALTRIGGEWKGGRTKAHVFQYDPADALSALIETGTMPPKNPTAFFPTPAAVIAEILDAAGIQEADTRALRILEPSAGLGAIADAARRRAPNATIECVEVLDLSAAALRKHGHSVTQCDFLTYSAEPFDVVLMNPPFSLADDKQAYATHILHAWALLKPYGQLVAIAPEGWTFATAAWAEAFRRFVFEYGTFEQLPPQAFKASGTLVSTVLITAKKWPEDEARYQIEGWHCQHCWRVALTNDNDRTAHASLVKIARHPAPFRAALNAHLEKLIAQQKLPVILRAGCWRELHDHYAAMREEESPTACQQDAA